MLDSRAEPVIRNIVRSRFQGRGSNPADVEDVCSEAMLALLSTLDRRDAAAAPIADFDAFVAVIAYRACSDYLRRRHPAFHRMRTRLRYVLQTHREFAVWRDPSGLWLCGLRRWQQGAMRV